MLLCVGVHAGFSLPWKEDGGLISFSFKIVSEVSHVGLVGEQSDSSKGASCWLRNPWRFWGWGLERAGFKEGEGFTRVQ